MLSEPEFIPEIAKYHRHADFASHFVEPRNIDVWCPPGYMQQPDRRYGVIYMHDGQNLFDAAQGLALASWGIAETLTDLIAEGDDVFEVIVVGIWNSGLTRAREYTPQAVFESFTPEQQAAWSAEIGGEPFSDAYLQFLVEEVKPFIDATYRTKPDTANTTVMGSSRGGIISLYAISRYPEIFSKAGCLSTHWISGGSELVDYMGQHLPDPANHKLYFDYGTLGYDSQYEPYQLRMNKLLDAAGYTLEENYVSLKFEGDDHNEQAWNKRLAIPLRFLLG